jgi:hypothetical protein
MAWKWPGSSKNGASEEWTGFIDQGVTLEGTLQLTGSFPSKPWFWVKAQKSKARSRETEW